MLFEVITHGSPEYDEAVRFRDRLLRRPLGLTFTDAQLAAEVHSHHLGGYIADVLQAYCMLTPRSAGEVQMRQVAVTPELQGQGYGRRLTEFAENYARQLSVRVISCHARDSAVPFYEKQGYLLVGEPFEEVTIMHQKMEKRLS